MKKTEHNSYALLDRDVRDTFPDDESVNEALRVILIAAQTLARRLRTKEKTPREQNYEEKVNCRVLALSGKRVLYATPIRQSRRDLRKRIVTNQRRLLQIEHPELKNMTNVRYLLQWRTGDRWVND